MAPVLIQNLSPALAGAWPPLVVLFIRYLGLLSLQVGILIGLIVWIFVYRRSMGCRQNTYTTY